MSIVSDLVLVIGHRNPDTDAVCSVLAYAALVAWQRGQPAEPCYLDDLNPETCWVLERLGLEPPRAISDVYLRVADVMERNVPRLGPEQTLREAGLLMQHARVRGLPVVDAAGRLVGLIERDQLADRYLAQLQLAAHIDLPVTLLLRTLDATLLAGELEAVVQQQLWIATMTEAAVRSQIGAGDAVIVGDQPGVQRAALTAGAGCLIVTDGVGVAPEITQLAIERGVLLLQTPYSPFAAALLLQQSIPVERVMRDLPEATIRLDALLAEAQEQLRRTNLPALAVVDGHGQLEGTLFRRHLTAQARRKVILTDHNHVEQAAPGVAESQIVAIIDHHNLGGLQTLQPLTMQIEPVGCTCTLIAEHYQRSNAPLTPALAGAMLAAILSDTVCFRSPTTTPRDRVAASWLEERSGLTSEDFARAMFRARLPTPTPPADWWVRNDYKIYTFGGQQIAVAQIELVAVAELMPPAASLCAALSRLVAEQGLDSAFLLLTDILEQGSLLLADRPASLELAAHAFEKTVDNGSLTLPGVMSRKQQVVPALAAALV